MPELTAEQAKAYLAAEQRLIDQIHDATYPTSWLATRARLEDDLRILQSKYSPEDITRALYGDDYL